MTVADEVKEIPIKVLKVRDLFKNRNSETDVIFDGDRNVLRLTKKKGQ